VDNLSELFDVSEQKFKREAFEFLFVLPKDNSFMKTGWMIIRAKGKIDTMVI